MKKIKPLNLITILLTLFLISCNQKTATKKSVEKETSIPSNRNAKKANQSAGKTEKTKRKTIVSVDATINGKKFVFDALDPKDTDPVVVFTKNGFYFLYRDFKNHVVKVALYSSDIFDTTPITFTQQVSALPIKDQATTKQKRSNLLFRIPGNPQRQGDAKNFYEGTVVLEKFTDDLIEISFKGVGFPTGINPKLPQYKNDVFPMKGKISIENYNIYDYR